MRNSPRAVFRSYPWAQQALCLAPLAVMIVFLASGVGTGDELTCCFTALRGEMPLLTETMEFLTSWLLYGIYAVYGLFLLRACITGDRACVVRVLIFALAQIVCTVLLVQFAKTAIGRPRPLLALGGAPYSPWVLESDLHSLPSGHTAEASGAASVLAAEFRRSALSLVLGLFVALVAFSRLYLSRHHLSDVVAGACLGLGASLLNFYLCTGIRHDNSFRPLGRFFQTNADRRVR